MMGIKSPMGGPYQKVNLKDIIMGTPVPKSFKSVKMGIISKFWVVCDVASDLIFERMERFPFGTFYLAFSDCYFIGQLKKKSDSSVGQCVDPYYPTHRYPPEAL